MKQVLNLHHQVFEKPKEIPPSRGEHDHSVTLVPEAQLPNVRPYRYPFTQNNEIEKIIKELLESNVIHPSISPYSSTMVMVLNKLVVKDKFPILVVAGLLDELHCAELFTQLGIHFGYHQIGVKEVDIPKTSF